MNHRLSLLPQQSPRDPPPTALGLCRSKVGKFEQAAVLRSLQKWTEECLKQNDYQKVKGFNGVCTCFFSVFTSWRPHRQAFPE